MHLFQPPQPGWAFLITSLLIIGACFVREKAHSNRRKDTKDMLSVFFVCQFWSMLFQHKFSAPAHCENGSDVEKSWEQEIQMHWFKIRCTGSKLDALACHSRCRSPGTGWSSQIFFEPAKYLLSYGRKINSKYGWYQSWRSYKQCDISLPSSSIESYLKG